MTTILVEQWINFSRLGQIRFFHRFHKTLSVVSNLTLVIITGKSLHKIKTERVEALRLILLLSLLLWRLVERDLNLYVKNTGNLLPGWDKRMTKSPTAFMMTTKFLNVLVITAGKQRQLAKPLNDIQLQYIKALGISPKCFSEP